MRRDEDVDVHAAFLPLTADGIVRRAALPSVGSALRRATGGIEVSQIVTGEVVALDIRVARLGSRGVATLLDLVVQITIFVGLISVLTAADLRLDEAAVAAVALLLYVLVFLGYPVGLESLWRGKTLGKAAMGLRVVRDDGGPIRFRHALVRGLVGVFLERPGMTFGIAAIVSSLVSAHSKRLGDLAAGTVVVQERVPVRYSQGIPMPPPLIPWAQSLDLSRLPDDLALAVRQFLDRAPQLKPAAREQVGHSLTSAVLAAVTPAPPSGTPGWAILSAVLAERRRREEQRISQQRYAGAPVGVAGPVPGPSWQGPPAPGWGATPPVPTWAASAPAVGTSPPVGAAPPVSPAPSLPAPSAVPPGPIPIPPPEPVQPDPRPSSPDDVPPAPPDGFVPPS
jgi:uncharacterized RDD family membrane protein YckC